MNVGTVSLSDGYYTIHEDDSHRSLIQIAVFMIYHSDCEAMVNKTHY